jgi:hypothetical protein
MGRGWIRIPNFCMSYYCDSVKYIWSHLSMEIYSYRELDYFWHKELAS